MENFTQFKITPGKSWADIQEEEEEKVKEKANIVSDLKKNLSENNVKSSKKCIDERNNITSKQ